MSTETAPAILTATGLVVRHNEQVVLDGASLTVCEGNRLGLVGRNGSGKSTFLKILAGELVPDAGTVSQRKDLIIGYLPQAFSLEPQRTVLENIRSGAKQVLDLIQEFELLPADSKRHSSLEHRIHTLDGWGLDNRIQTAMSHLFVPAVDRLLGSLSGGEQRRVALCRALVARPDLLLLDEPTNHLDPQSVEWMADYLQNYPGTFLLVTHDRYFLDQVTSGMAELANGTFYCYEGNYTDYLIAKAERQAAEEVLEGKRQSYIRRELDWVRRGPPARTTKSKSRLDRFYATTMQGAPTLEGDVELVIPPPPPLGNRIVDLTNAGVELGGRILFRGLTFKFEKGMRIGIAGRNGAGKTTLLKVIMGQLTPTEGTVKLGNNLEFNYVDQGRMQLNEEKTVLQEMSDGTEYVVFGNGKLSVRAYLKRFLFADDRINTQVSKLSGGERSRLLMARILKRGGNFLVLDEPTNDLDLPTLRILEEALLAFPGCVVVVSHDRYFLNRVCTGVLVFEEPDQVIYSVGDYDYYVEKRRMQAAAAQSWLSFQAAARPARVPEAGLPKPRKLTWKEQKELEGLSGQIESTEAAMARIEALFCDPEFHRKHGAERPQLDAQLLEAQQKRDRLYARWEELEAIARAHAERSSG